MPLLQILLVSFFAVGMGLGQLLLKYAASRQSESEDLSLVERILRMVIDWPFILGAASYAILLVFWVWLLTFIPLSRAYPFTIISIAVATIGSWLFFGETLTPKFLIGLFIIAIGLIILGMD
jgi:drug/metabolite transporter (DMT)-like permease